VIPIDKSIEVLFFKLNSGREPVKDWLSSLSVEQGQTVARDIKRLQFCWPIGMPLARKIYGNLWELRSRHSSIITKVIFYI
jgi:hypothetical protein